MVLLHRRVRSAVSGYARSYLPRVTTKRAWSLNNTERKLPAERLQLRRPRGSTQLEKYQSRSSANCTPPPQNLFSLSRRRQFLPKAKGIAALLLFGPRHPRTGRGRIELFECEYYRTASLTPRFRNLLHPGPSWRLEGVWRATHRCGSRLG